MAKGKALTMGQQVKVYKFIEAQKEKLEEEGSNYKALSEQATLDLGFNVSTGYIKKAIGEAGIEIKLKKSSSKQAYEKLFDLCIELASNGDFKAEFMNDLIDDPEVPQPIKDTFID